MQRLLATVVFWAVVGTGTGVAADDCLSCHRQRDPALVAAWEQSRHNRPGTDCHACHGPEHDGRMAARARHNDACIGCHPRESGSYTISKHGVIATLEAGRTDFTQPLRDGNIRSPSCAYCHIHAGNHAVGVASADLDKAGRAEARAAPCRDCHSPRLIDTWFSTGDRMVEIGQMKAREAAAVVTAITRRDAEAGAKAQEIVQHMTAAHLRNVRLGVGHQSPDDQWWHGHPALDGDLLRIKSILSDQLRLSAGP
ncbi:MAG: hypothetical protein HQL82_04005 [Magnetococcales bacterium]|nr:hypothetical protein [Magnetococcales bacterium]